MKIFHDSLDTHTVVLVIQNVSRCIAKIKNRLRTSQLITVEMIDVTLRYGKAPVGAYKPTEEEEEEAYGIVVTHVDPMI